MDRDTQVLLGTVLTVGSLIGLLLVAIWLVLRRRRRTPSSELPSNTASAGEPPTGALHAESAVVAPDPISSLAPEVPNLPATKICPRCAEEVKGAALICRFCGYEFPDPLSGLPAGPPGPPVVAPLEPTSMRSGQPPSSPSLTIPTAAAEKRGSRTPLLILVIVVAAVGVGALFMLSQQSVSDAASTWCAANSGAVVTTGRHLGVFPPDGLPVSIGTTRYTVKTLKAMDVARSDIDKLLIGDTTVIADWSAADAGSFARACNAAFGAR